MIIPIKCFTCGNVLADKYQFYLRRVKQLKLNGNKEIQKVVYLTEGNMDKTPEGETLDQLRLFNVCCRRHMLTHVDIH
jgi:DNA-directed RNA polymerase subunit N (RpoN/RPB10)